MFYDHVVIYIKSIRNFYPFYQNVILTMNMSVVLFY